MSEVKKVVMLGNEAIARGAYEAGVKVSAAYPGTPNTKTIFTVNGLRMRRSQQKLRLEHLSQVSGLCPV